MNDFTVGSLFAGVGGLDLGLQRAGFQIKWQVELDDFCRRVLEKHWPDVRRWDDVTTFPPASWAEEHLAVDLICAGFPCQDISIAGNKEGLKGERSALFYEVIRLVGHLRPRICLLENVSALLGRGLGIVLSELAALGFDAEWHCIPASALGAPHERDRIFVIATNTDGAGLGQQRRPKSICKKLASTERSGWWATESELDRVSDGFPGRVDRLKALGNSVVPQVAEYLGNQIMRRMT